MLAGISGILKVVVFLNFANLIVNIFINCILTKKPKQNSVYEVKGNSKSKEEEKDLLKEKNKEKRKTFALIMGLKLLR